MNSLVLVVPCWNEARRLVPEEFLEALRAYPYLSFVFVDDGSTDSTAETLALLESASPSVRALYLPKNVGKAEAVRAGIEWTLFNTSCEAVGFWDADLATPLTEIPAFVAALEANRSCEAAIGARWPHLGVRIDRNVFRHCTGLVMKSLIRLVLRAPVYDSQCGAKVFRRELAEKVFARRFVSRWLFDVEILKRLKPRELRQNVLEVPLGFWRDVEGSKLGLRDSLMMIPELVRIGLGGAFHAKL